MRIAHWNFDEHAGNEPVNEIYDAIKSRVGFFDYIAALASKSIVRAKNNPDLDLCFPTQYTTGSQEFPIGIAYIDLVQPFRPKHVETEVPNNSYYGNTVNLVTGPNSGVKTYFWHQTIIPARIAAGLGDIVNASEFRYDPKGRIVIPYIPDEVDKSKGGFDATARAFIEGLRTNPIYKGDLIIQDEAGGTTSESVEAHMVSTRLRELAAKGIGTFYITHNRQLIDEFSGSSHPQIGVINCPLETIRGELQPTHRFTSGPPNWKNYFAYAVNIVDKRTASSGGIITLEKR